ncbi:MAG: hypothetical protein ACE5H2_10255 [Terriglobia bacterium]
MDQSATTEIQVRDDSGKLTEGAKDLIRHLRAGGASRREVAEQLQITEKTVEHFESRDERSMAGAQRGISRQLHRLVRDAADLLQARMPESSPRVLADVISKLGNLALTYEGRGAGQQSVFNLTLTYIQSLPDEAKRAVLDALRRQEAEALAREERQQAVLSGAIDVPAEVLPL